MDWLFAQKEWEVLPNMKYFNFVGLFEYNQSFYR